MLNFFSIVDVVKACTTITKKIELTKELLFFALTVFISMPNDKIETVYTKLLVIKSSILKGVYTLSEDIMDLGYNDDNENTFGSIELRDMKKYLSKIKDYFV